MANPTKIELADKVIAMVKAATGEMVIPGNDNAPAPNGLYATVLLLDIEAVGVDSVVGRDATNPALVDITLKGTRIATFSVQFYRAGAQDALEKLLAFRMLPTGELWFDQNNIIWYTSSAVRVLDTVMGSMFEERRSIDIGMQYITTTTQTVNGIASAAINIEMSDSVDISDATEVIEP